MEAGYHSLSALFEQLGLAASHSEIETFLATHRLKEGQAITEADFWSESQIEFLKESLEDDSDWAEQVDELSTLLSQ